MRQELREQPGAGEEDERVPQRRAQLEQPRGSQRQSELEQSERHGRPARLVREQWVVHGRVERETDQEHQPDQLEGPPLVQDRREHGGDEDGRDRAGQPRLDAAPQRVGHETTRRLKRRAATFIPTSVSAAGYAHWPGTPASASVRVASVRPGTVESSARTIQRSSLSSPCSSTSRASSGSCRNPALNPVAQITCSAPSTVGEMRKRPSRSAASIGASQARPGGYDGSPKPCLGRAARGGRA